MDVCSGFVEIVRCDNESGTGFESKPSLSGDVVDSREKRASSGAFRRNRLFIFYFDVRALRLLINSMGLRMENIHTPTVPSGSTTRQEVANGVDKDKLSLMSLIDEKTKVEEELTALGSVLDSVCHCSQSCLTKQLAADRSFYSTAWRQHDYHPNNLRRIPTG